MEKGRECFDVGIVGLGYVGLTLAVSLAKSGFKVIGIERRKDVVGVINSGKAHFYEKGLDESIQNVIDEGSFKALQCFNDRFYCNSYIITVGTPLDINGGINVQMIKHAAKEVSSNMENGALIILRSTVKIGTTRNIVKPILNQTGKKFCIAMCPERTLEGKALHELRNLPQIVGSDSVEARNRAYDLFSKLTKIIIKVDSLETAEVIKLVDNTFRDLQFAFANEVSRICEVYGVNAYDVVKLGKQGYERTNVPLPGPVGGPCLEKDSHILSQSAKEKNIDVEITNAVRLVNERQPLEIAQFLKQKAEERSLGEDLQIALLGMAFKGRPANDDLRGSMSIKILDQLTRVFPKAKVKLYDAEVTQEVLQEEFQETEIHTTLEGVLKDSSIVVIANNHLKFEIFGLYKMKRMIEENGFVYDCWNLFSDLPKRQKENYFAIGCVK